MASSGECLTVSHEGRVEGSKFLDLCSNPDSRIRVSLHQGQHHSLLILYRRWHAALARAAESVPPTGEIAQKNKKLAVLRYGTGQRKAGHRGVPAATFRCVYRAVKQAVTRLLAVLSAAPTVDTQEHLTTSEFDRCEKRIEPV